MYVWQHFGRIVSCDYIAACDNENDILLATELDPEGETKSYAASINKKTWGYLAVEC